MKNYLILVRGLPGSGKSTMADKYLGYVRLENDMYLSKDGKYSDVTPEEIQAAIAWCKVTADIMLAARRSVVVCNCMTTMRHLANMAVFAVKHGAVLAVAECTGEYGSVHNVPPEAIERMKAEWQPFSLKELNRELGELMRGEKDA